MPRYTVREPGSGRIYVFDGDSPPTEQEIADAIAHDPTRKPASGDELTPGPPDSGGLLANMARAILPSTTPSDYVQGPLYAARHPLDSLSLLFDAIKNAHIDQAHKGAAAAREVVNAPTLGGKTAAASELLGHGVAALLPIVGPAAAHAGEQIASGDVRGGVGSGLGLVSGVLAPGAAAAVVRNARIPGLGQRLTPPQAEAVAFGEREGIPLDPATVTGRPIMRKVQKRLGDTLGGSSETEKFQATQAEALSATGRKLAAKADPSGPSSPELAGEAMREGVRGEMQRSKTAADAAYQKFRDIAEQHQETVQTQGPEPAPADAPTRFTMEPSALPDKVFEAVYQDAKQNGYLGTRQDLRARFDEQLRIGMSGMEEQASIRAEYGPQALLQSIRQLGGIQPFTKDLGTGAKLRGDFASIVESFGAKGGWSQRGAGSIFRKNGLGLDDMVDQLRQDPRWRPIIQDENDLLDALDEIAREGPTKTTKPTVEDALSISDARPGAKWWIDRKQETQALPVAWKTALEPVRPLYEDLLRQSKLAPQSMVGDKAKALMALDKVFNGPDVVPASVADPVLSDLKAFARSDVPELRSAGQGAVARAVGVLDRALQESVGHVAPEALDALQAGRAATRAKYDAGAVLDKLREEPVQAFGQATMARDAGVKFLRQVAAKAPDALPKVGRAYLDDLIDKATTNGKFERAAGLAASWEKLGPETKKLLFKDPAYIRDLDNFFRLAKTIGENPNPSGTAGVLTATNLSTYLPFKVTSKLLYSRAGIRRLVNGLRLLPSRTPTGRVVLPSAAGAPRPTTPGGGSLPTLAATRKQDDEIARR
jgi:hypothetical protein